MATLCGQSLVHSVVVISLALAFLQLYGVLGKGAVFSSFGFLFLLSVEHSLTVLHKSAWSGVVIQLLRIQQESRSVRSAYYNHYYDYKDYHFLPLD